MEVQVLNFEKLDNAERRKILKGIFNIFIESSNRKNFNCEKEKEDFFDLWVSPYIKNFSNFIWVALSDKGELLGYLTGCMNTLSAMRVLNYPSLNKFKEYYHSYPAHLHINCRSDTRGLGIGTKLVDCFVNQLKSKNSLGVHIITSVDALNISFYKKMGLKIISTKDELLLMAQSL